MDWTLIPAPAVGPFSTSCVLTPPLVSVNAATVKGRIRVIYGKRLEDFTKYPPGSASSNTTEGAVGLAERVGLALRNTSPAAPLLGVRGRRRLLLRSGAAAKKSRQVDSEKSARSDLRFTLEKL